MLDYIFSRLHYSLASSAYISRHRLDAQTVAVRAEAAYLTYADGSEHLIVTELLTRVDVGHMYLNHGDLRRNDSVAETYRVVRPRPRIHNDTVELSSCGVELLRHSALVVGGKELKLDALTVRPLLQTFIDILKGNRTVRPLIPNPRHAKINAVKHKNFHVITSFRSKSER